jgi:large subunit ribosomal protein L25
MGGKKSAGGGGMIADVKLDVSTRTIYRKKVDKLRNSGIIPGVIFGKGFDSLPVQVNSKDFEKVYKKIHGTSMFELNVDGKPLKALIHSLQRDKISRKVLHIDFLKVDLKERVSVEVPLVMVGHSPLEEAGLGLLSQQTMSLHVKCLPEDIPDEIKVDRSFIQTKEGVIHAADVELPQGVTLASEAEREKIIAAFMIARIQEPKKEEEVITEEEAPPAE